MINYIPQVPPYKLQPPSGITNKIKCNFESAPVHSITTHRKMEGRQT